MSNERTRDDRIVTIATALAVMLGTFLLGVLGLLAAATLTGLSSQTVSTAPMWVAITAIGIGIGYLIRTKD